VSRRLLFSYLSLALVVLAALEIPLGVVNARSEHRALASRVERDAVAVASLAESTVEHDRPADISTLRRLASRYAKDTGGRVVVVDATGRAIVDTSPPAPGVRNFASRPEFNAALHGSVASGTRHSNTLHANFLYVAVPIASGGRVLGAARVTYPTSTLDARVRRYWLVLAGIAGIVLAVAALIGASFARWLSRPVVALERAAARVGEGDLGARAVLPDGPPELRALTIQFNETVAKLESLVGAQRDFVADASHELRTPLTALRLRLENLERHVEEEGRAGFHAAAAEIERLSGIVESLLSLARADAGTVLAEPRDLAELAAARLDAWHDAAAEKGVTVKLETLPEPCPVVVGPDRVAQILDNLIANALAAAPPGTDVTIGVHAAGDRVELTVSDRGPGLSDEQKARAFDRFWRAAGKAGGGSGLGLAIVRRLAEADGGTVALRDAAGGGLEAVVRFPLATGRVPVPSRV
jgi:signal transduction histidine kinase